MLKNDSALQMNLCPNFLQIFKYGTKYYDEKYARMQTYKKKCEVG